MVKIRQTCRICRGPLKEIFNLGEFPIIGYDDSIKRKVPLCLCRCDIENNENACGLVQLKHSVPPYMMYEQYFYVSGINENMVHHLHEVADISLEVTNLQPDDLIVDIGCNDGSLLDYYSSLGFKNLFGIDPARNLPKVNDEIKVIQDYFNEESVKIIQGQSTAKKAKLITSIAMFYDLENPHTFVDTICSVLDRDGMWILEMAYLPAVLKLNTFDTICHEHLEYYTLAALEHLLNSHKLEVVDVFENDVNGGSFRIHVTWKGSRQIHKSAYSRIRRMKMAEFELKLDTDEPYADFVRRIKYNGEQLRSFLLKEKDNGKKIYAYGASTKGFTVLGYYNIDHSIVEACADRNEMKWGSIMRGSNIPIISEAEARAAAPDYFLVLPWHFVDGFIEREKEFLARGGKFVVPMPKFRVIGNE